MSAKNRLDTEAKAICDRCLCDLKRLLGTDGAVKTLKKYVRQAEKWEKNPPDEWAIKYAHSHNAAKMKNQRAEVCDAFAAERKVRGIINGSTAKKERNKEELDAREAARREIFRIKNYLKYKERMTLSGQ